MFDQVPGVLGIDAFAGLRVDLVDESVKDIQGCTGVASLIGRLGSLQFCQHRIGDAGLGNVPHLGRVRYAVVQALNCRAIMGTCVLFLGKCRSDSR